MNAAANTAVSLMSGYIDAQGRWAIAPNLRRAPRFVGGLAPAVPFGTADFGLIGRDGQWVVAPHCKLYGQASDEDGVWSYNVGGAPNDRGRIVGGAWGLAGHGRNICDPVFEDATRMRQGLIAVKQGGKWGYANAQGQVVIAADYAFADEFNDGFAVISDGERDGYVDKAGQVVIPLSFERAASFSGGRGRIMADGQWYYIDAQGNVISEGYDEALPFLDGMARVKRGEGYNFIGLDGRLLSQTWFGEVKPYSDGFAPVARDGEWYFLTRNGQTFGPFVTAMTPTSGLARFVRPGQGVGFLDIQGQEVIPAKYDSARGFNDGWAAVLRDERWTFVDTQGRELHSPRWQDVGQFAEGFAPVKIDGLWGVISTNHGEVVAPPRFDTIDTFSGGLAAARRVRWPQVQVPNPAWHAVPAEGLTHKVFETDEPGLQLRATWCYGAELSPEVNLAIQQVFYNWKDLMEFDAQGQVLHNNRFWMADYALSVRVQNLADPVRSVRLLEQALVDVGAPIQEVTYAPLSSRREAPFMLYGTLAVPHPDDPGGSAFFPDFETYLGACFDRNGTPPASESLQHLLAGRWNQREGTIFTDERVMSLHLPDIRVCYGCAQDTFVDPDPRTAQVGAALTEALERRFDRSRIWVFPGNRNWTTPVPTTRDNDVGVEKIINHGRVGYCFGVDSFPLLQDVGPDVFRYREPELMEAVADAVRQLGLAPVITWQRFGNPLPGPAMAGMAHPMQPTVYVVNVWER